MTTNELMIGDWVYNKHHEKAIRITPFDFFTHGHRGDGKQYIVGLGQRTIGKDLDPIPLTPEILEKNGFERRDDLVKRLDDELPFILPWEDCSVVIGWRDSYDNGLRDENATYWSEYWHVAIDGKNVTFDKYVSKFYVHELQHALRLCGIDKEIML